MAVTFEVTNGGKPLCVRADYIVCVSQRDDGGATIYFMRHCPHGLPQGEGDIDSFSCSDDYANVIMKWKAAL